MGHKRNAKVSPELEEELRERLEEVLDQIDDVSDKRRRLSKKLGDHLKVLAETRDLVRRQLKGIDLDQIELPGTEVPAPAQDPLVQEILRIAGGIVDRKDLEVDGEPEPLVWRTSHPGYDLAKVKAGTYSMEATGDGNVTAKWSPLEGTGKLLGIRVPVDQAREACRTHHLQRHADELLKAAGHGDLTKGDLKGPPEARKKGRG
jgi:hypothetical protein